MPDDVLISTGRTPIGKALGGAFNQPHRAVLTAHAITHAVERAGVEPGEVDRGRRTSRSPGPGM